MSPGDVASSGHTRPTLLYLTERAKRAVFDFLLFFGPNPVYAVKSTVLRHKHEGNLPLLARRFGVRLETLQHQERSGLDNPSYRFHRDKELFAYLIEHADRFRGCSWLDVGADTGALSVYLSEILGASEFEMCDVEVAARTNFPVTRIDGTSLNYDENSFDLVFFSYVLHHAGDNTIPLLRDAHRIARKHVIVMEDPKETDADCLWAHAHDPHGTFRGKKEWLELFASMRFSLVYDAPLESDGHNRHFFILTPQKCASNR